MQQEQRKAAIAAYKERKSVPANYANRCLSSGQCWVGRAADLATVRNRVAFALRMGSSPHRSLQAAARAHGEAGFAFEEVERLEAETLSPELRDLKLKKRLDHWRDALGAEAI